MSNIKMVGNERIEVVNHSQDLALRLYDTDGSLAPYTIHIPKEDLGKIIEVLQEAQRLFGLAPKLNNITIKPFSHPLDSIGPTGTPNIFNPPQVRYAQSVENYRGVGDSVVGGCKYGDS